MWVVFSVLWVCGFWIAIYDVFPTRDTVPQTIPIGDTTRLAPNGRPDDWVIRDRPSIDQGRTGLLAALMFGVPLGLLIAGCVCSWIAQGFRSQ